MGTPKELINVLIEAAETVGKKMGPKSPEVIEAEIKAKAAKNFFSTPLIVEHTSSDDIPELPTPQTSLSERYQED